MPDELPKLRPKNWWAENWHHAVIVLSSIIVATTFVVKGISMAEQNQKVIGEL